MRKHMCGVIDPMALGFILGLFGVTFTVWLEPGAKDADQQTQLTTQSERPDGTSINEQEKAGLQVYGAGR